MRIRTLLFLGALATAAAAAPGAEPSVLHFEAARVQAAFAKGMPLLENRAYKVHASRRVEPGMAEVHERDTDIIHVQEGEATLVVGGSVVGGRAIAPDEIRGTAIAGGTAYALGVGDVIVVPSGTPHWFQDVRGPLLYYVVKVTS